MYKCSQCGTTFDKLPEGILRCPNCASKILYKLRDPVAKNLKAR